VQYTALFMLHSGKTMYISLQVQGVTVMKKTGAFLGTMVAAGLMLALAAEAGQFRLGHKYGISDAEEYQLSQNYDDNSSDGYGGGASVSPSQAASIAKRSWPGSKVLRVRLLPSGVYAVTLKQGGEVAIINVDASSGDLS
jgi:hypothetical protein